MSGCGNYDHEFWSKTMSTQEPETNKDKSRSWLLLSAGLVGLIAIALILFFGFSPTVGSSVSSGSKTDVSSAQQPILPESGPPLQIGDLPYNFTLADVEGNAVALDQFIGRPLILNFWATWCGPCRIEMPHLQKTFTAHQDDGLVILALNQDETAAEVTQFFDEFGLTFTPLLDEGKATSENYGVGRILPTTFFINTKGEITAIHHGPMTQSQIDGYLTETPAS